MAQGERWQEENLAQKQADEEARAQGFLPKKKKVRKDRKAPADPNGEMTINEAKARLLIAAGAVDRTGLDLGAEQPQQVRTNGRADDIIPSNHRGIVERTDIPGTRVEIDVNHPANFAMTTRGRSGIIEAAKEAGKRWRTIGGIDSPEDQTAVAQGLIKPNRASTGFNP